MAIMPSSAIDVTGTESHVALAILGDAEIGDKVLFENFSYELIRQ